MIELKLTIKTKLKNEMANFKKNEKWKKVKGIAFKLPLKVVAAWDAISLGGKWTPFFS